MAASFFFYDLETSGLNPRTARIMQFAGQRTTMALEPMGEPVNVLIKLTPDVVPDPDAIMITGITPQTTLTDGVTEAEFLKQFQDEIAIPDTIFLGYNTVRFDDEFMRLLMYRNFTDPYEWQWKDGRSRWDILDLVRMTRALRPKDITWPFSPDGTASNRLELLTKVNNLSHEHAHDALSDVHATIAVAELIREKQEKLFSFLLDIRDKKKAEALVTKNQPFVYTSGTYPSEYEKTTVVVRVADHPSKRCALVYDLRQDPTEFLTMSVSELAERMHYTKDDSAPKRLPIKNLQYNKCPAIAPLGVMDEESQKRLNIDMKLIQKHLVLIRQTPGFADALVQAADAVDKKQQASFVGDTDVDGQIYDGFVGDEDKHIERAIRAAEPAELQDWAEKLHDERLRELVPRYKARNYPQALTTEERAAWETFCRKRLLDGGNTSPLAKYFARLQVLAADATLSSEKTYILEELQLYGQSIMPVDDDA